MGKFTFTKEERLRKEIWIKELFEKGSSFNLYPFRIIIKQHPDQAIPFHQVLISVSIRNYKKAVDRNSLKRKIRESYRLNKALLNSDSKLMIAYIYTSRTKEDSEKIRSGMVRALEMISSKDFRLKS